MRQIVKREGGEVDTSHYYENTNWNERGASVDEFLNDVLKPQDADTASL